MTTCLTTLAFVIPLTSLYAMSLKNIDNSKSSLLMIAIELMIISILIILFISRRSHQYVEAKKEMSGVPASVQAVQDYIEIRRKHKENEDQLSIKKFVMVENYIKLVLSPYMKEQDIDTLCDNIHLWMSSEDEKLKSVTTDGRLASIDLRHLAWNIGERFGWSGEKRAMFIKTVFPVELKDIEISTIRRNLRQIRTCIIELDIPEKGEFNFSYTYQNTTGS